MQGPAIFIDLTLEDQVIARVFDKIVCVNDVTLLKICEKKWVVCRDTRFGWGYQC